MCALFMTAGGIGVTLQANAEPSGIVLVSAGAQDTAQNTSATGVSGNWQMSWTDKNGDPKQGTLQLTQDGSSLSGTFQGPRASAPLTGSIQGNQISLTAKAHGREVSFTGTVDGSKMSGTTGQGKSWSATRQ